MPVVVTFDLEKSNDHARLQVAFERLGWQWLGGTAYRYPKLGAELSAPLEDWFNHVIPALMLLGAYGRNSGKIKACTIDAQSSTGFDDTNGSGPLVSNRITLYQPHDTKNAGQFGTANLSKWIDSTAFPYDPR